MCRAIRLSLRLISPKVFQVTETTLSYADVALQSGFTSLQYMYSVYRRELGCTPVEYRKKAVEAGYEPSVVWLLSDVAK